MSPHPWHVGGVDLPDGPLIIGQDPAQTKGWLKVMPVESDSYTPVQRDGNSGRVLYPKTLE